MFSVIGVSATFSYLSMDVTFSPSDDTWVKDNGEPVNNVQDALDSLYSQDRFYTTPELKEILNTMDTRIDLSDAISTSFMTKASASKPAAKAIMDSSAFRSNTTEALLTALNTALVPTVSNNTNVIASSIYSSAWDAYMAFRSTGNSWCTTNGAVNNSYIGYNFNKNVNVRIAKFINGGTQGYPAKTVKLQCSSDNVTWIDASDATTLSNSNITVFVYNTKLDEGYQYWRILNVNSYNSSYIEIYGLQFYGI